MVSVLAAQEVGYIDSVLVGRVAAIGENVGTLSEADIGQFVNEGMRGEKG